jgi:small-conductance mechanosensitive channel
MEAYLEQVGTWVVTSGPRIIVILLLLLVAIKSAQLVSARLLGKWQENKDEEYKKRTDTLSSVIRNLLTITIIVIASVMILGELGVKIGPILAAAGIAGVAIGFGAQHLIKDLIGGFFILLDDQIRVGDVVQIAGTGGLVEKIGLRMTVLRDLAGNVHYVPNGTIDVVTNMTKEYSRYVFDIGVAYREDVDEVIEIVKQIDQDLRSDPQFADDILEPIEILGLDQFADSAVIIKARTKTRPIRQWAVGREFNRRLKRKFDEKNVEIPFPHVTLYMGQDKDGQSPPLHLDMNQK